MGKLYKEVPTGKWGTELVEVTQEEVNRERENYREGRPHTHIFGQDTYAASGWYERRCIVCGYVDYV